MDDVTQAARIGRLSVAVDAPFVEVLPVDDSEDYRHRRRCTSDDDNSLADPAAPAGAAEDVGSNPLEGKQSSGHLSWKSNVPAMMDASPYAFPRRAALLWLEYDDAGMEERYISQWLYRTRRNNLTCLCIMLIVPFLAFALTSPATSWYAVSLSSSSGIFFLVAVLNYRYGCVVAPVAPTPCTVDEAALTLSDVSAMPPEVTSSRRAHEALLLVTFAAFGLFSSANYSYVRLCQEMYSEEVAHCANRISLTMMAGACGTAVIVPARMKMKLPFVLIIFPLAAFLPRLEYPEVESGHTTALKIAVTMSLSLVFAAVAVFIDHGERISFEATVVADSRAKRATALRRAIDLTLAGSLPLSVAQRLTTGVAVCDVSTSATIGLCELLDFAAMSVQQMLPSTTTRFINELFSAFDRWAAKLQCSRLKAVGDMYVIAAGLQSPREPTEACESVVRTALYQLQFVKHVARSLKIPFSVRLLVHSGRAVGGLMGLRTLTYEVFGPTIDGAKASIGYCPRNCVVATDATHQLCTAGALDSSPLFEVSDVPGVSQLFHLRAIRRSNASTPSDDGLQFLTHSASFESSTSSSSVVGGTDVRYGALTAAVLSERRDDPLIDTISSLSDVSLIFHSANAGSETRKLIEKTEVRGAAEPSTLTAMIPPLASSAVGQSVRHRVCKLLESAQPAQAWAMSYTSEPVEDVFRSFERVSFTTRAQVAMAGLNMVFVATIACAEPVDVGSVAVGGTVACCLSFMLSGVWLLALRSSRFQDRCSSRRTATVFTLCIVALADTALALYPPSIVTASVSYSQAIILSLIFIGCPSWIATVVIGGGTTATNLVVGWNQADRTALRNLMIALPLLVLVAYISFLGEKAKRAYFELVCRSNSHLRACEDELTMQCKMYELLLPPSLAKTTIHFKLTSRPGSKSFAIVFDQLCIVALRIDGLSSIMNELLDEPQVALSVAETIFFRIEEVLKRAIAECCPSKYAAISDELMCKMSTIGDEVVLGGPLLRQRAPDDILALSATVAMRFIYSFIADIGVIEPTANDCAPRFEATIVAAFHSATLVLLESECLSLQLYGTGPWQAQGLLRAAPRAFVGCTESFKALAERPGSSMPTGCSIADSELWRVRGVGSTMVSRISATRSV